jgi:hypothetical protein
VFKGKNDTETDGGLKTYTGNCHCGAVTIVYHTKPLPEVEGIKSCNCSICARVRVLAPIGLTLNPLSLTRSIKLSFTK